MSFLSSLIVSSLVVLSLSSACFAAEYVEEGRVGVEAIATANALPFQGGVVYMNDFLDVAADLFYQSSKTNDTNGNQLSKTKNLGTEFRLGKRFNMSNYNYVVAGAFSTFNFGSSDATNTTTNVSTSVSTNGTYAVGPYVGLQRHFPGTGVALTVYVTPYQHSVSYANDGSGGKNKTVADSFLSNGGVGIVYLF